MGTLLWNYEETMKKDMMQKNKKHAIEQDFMKNVNKQLLQHLENCICFSLALDESCDI